MAASGWLPILVTLAGLITSGFAFGQDARDRGRRGQPDDSGAAVRLGALSLQLAQRVDVQRELRMTAAQIKDVRQLVQDTQQRVRGRYGIVSGDLSPQERRDAYAQLQKKIRSDRQGSGEKLVAILNRRQQARLAQLGFRFNVQQGSPVGALAGAGVQLADEETAKLRETQRRVQAELRKKIAQLQHEANMEILGSVLGHDRIERLMGDEFTFVGGVPPRGSGQEASGSAGDDRRRDSGGRGQSRRDRRRRSSGGR